MCENKNIWLTKPEKIIEWQDAETGVKGYLVINELLNGACGGGTRISKSTNIEELTHLAKMMQLKFSIYGPPIGGAKSGLVMDANHPQKQAILKRWFTFIKPYLESCYGTAADLNTNFQEISLVLQTVGIKHPQLGLIRAVVKDEALVDDIIQRLKILNQPFMLVNNISIPTAQLVTGFLIAELVDQNHSLNKMNNQSIWIQGVGTVGSSAAYFLHKKGYKIIGLVDKTHGIIAKDGMTEENLMQLLQSFSIAKSCQNNITANEFYQQILHYQIPVFIPAAGSGLIDEALLSLLKQMQTQLIVSGANIPFANASVEQQAKQEIHVIPSYVSSGGLACAFNAFIQQKQLINNQQDLFNFIEQQVCALKI